MELNYHIKISWSQPQDQWYWSVSTTTTGFIADGYNSRKELVEADAEDAARKHARSYTLHQGREYVFKPFIDQT